MSGMLAAGVGLMTTGVIVVGVLVAAGVDPIWLSVPLFFTVASLGLILGNATALASAPFLRRPAAHRRCSNPAVRPGRGRLPLVGLGGEDTAAPMAIVMAASALIAVVALLASRAPHRQGVRPLVG